MHPSSERQRQVQVPTPGCHCSWYEEEPTNGGTVSEGGEDGKQEEIKERKLFKSLWGNNYLEAGLDILLLISVIIYNYLETGLE